MILLCDKPTTTLLINLLSESAVSCLLRVMSVSSTSCAKGGIKFVPHSCLEYYKLVTLPPFFKVKCVVNNLL
jgi:hypothetical protein